MYSLLALLGLIDGSGYLHVFAYRRRGYLALLVPGMAAMLYTHNWAAFYCLGAVAGAGAGLAGVGGPARDPDRRCDRVRAAPACCTCRGFRRSFRRRSTRAPRGPRIRRSRTSPTPRT